MRWRPFNSSRNPLRRPQTWYGIVAFAVAAEVLFALALLFVGRPRQAVNSVRPSLPSPAQPAAIAESQNTTPSNASSALAELTDAVEACMRSSRPVFLGSRDPAGPSCVPIVRRGDLHDRPPMLPVDLDGGPGMTMATLYFQGRQQFKNILDDYNWHQTRLRTHLENIETENADAERLAHALVEKAIRFHEMIDACPSWPAELNVTSLGEDKEGDWLRYCVSSLVKAAETRNLEMTRHWAAELASAAFGLEDLHRWLGFLARNQLTALDFQEKCQTLFTSAAAKGGDYDYHSTISHFPAGVLSLNGVGNYYEVEHQAERLFTMPADRIEEISFNRHFTEGSAWVLPSLRECFLDLEKVLSPENQKTWELAARTPYEHSYLVNMLFRCTRAGMTDEMKAVLKRFNANHPNASVQSLMSVLMYRGHSFAGLEWPDRYDPQLMAAAARIDGSDVAAFEAACKWTYAFYRTPVSYGVTLTLRDALSQKRLDCVRATDMIAALYRDSGHTGFGHVRWCAETNAHAVAACASLPEDNKRQILIGDGMNFGSGKLEVWPDAYFHGHAWPAGFENNPNPYAVELYVRGIDSYIWAEGYIVRGPNAGLLTRAAIPFSATHRQASSEKVFAGPYPD